MIFIISDAGSVTWFEPSPFETVKDPLIISTANESLVKGSLNGELSCNFSLSADLSIITVSMHFGGTSVANFAESQQAQSVSPGFEGHFNVTWVPNKLTLIFLNVTSEDEGEFRCDVLTLLSPGAVIQTWKRKIQVSLLGKFGHLVGRIRITGWYLLAVNKNYLCYISLLYKVY